VRGRCAFPRTLPAVAPAAPKFGELAALNPVPTMVVMIALEQDALKLVQAWDNGGSPTIAGLQWFMTDGARSAGFLAAAPTSLRTMCGSAPTFPESGLAYAELKRLYELANADVIEEQVFAPNVWDAFHLFAAAMVQQANRFPDEELGGDHLRLAITDVSREGQIYSAQQWREIISAIRAGNDIDYDGAAGPNNFDAAGQAVGPYEVWCIAGDGASFTRALFLDAEDISML